jgi:para-nitrobenzyl esterase
MRKHNHNRSNSDAGVGMDRRGFLSLMSSLAGGAVASPLLFDSSNVSAKSPAPSKPTGTVIVKTIYGHVRGTSSDGLMVFKGIPYAGSPAGMNRFKAPPKLKPWTGVKDALLYGAQAIQPPDPNWPKEWKPALSSEECLFLNVWTPGIADGRRRPVMFYSHGGGFATGNGGADVWPQNIPHDGAALARSYDVVVVTHNHRLGLLGYLFLGDLLGEEYVASGAAGMLDIAAGLEWVRDNIEAFGGDPGNVMIWGESGGGAKTATLTALPKAQGLYHRASIESGPTLRLTPRDVANEITRQVLSKVGLSEKQAREIVNLPAARLREVQQELSGPSPMRFAPVVDGHLIPSHPYDPVAPAMSAKIPMIIGTNKDESIFFNMGNPEVFSLDEAGLRSRLQPVLGEKLDRVLEVYKRNRPQASPTDLFIAITTAQWMWRNAIIMAERKVALKAAPVYMYLFAYESEAPVGPSIPYPRKAAHAEEIPFKFNHPDATSSKRPERVRAARNMSKAWATFARTGEPSHNEIPSWPAYTLEQRATMFLDAECKVVNDPYREERLVWNEIPLAR